MNSFLFKIVVILKHSGRCKHSPTSLPKIFAPAIFFFLFPTKAIIITPFFFFIQRTFMHNLTLENLLNQKLNSTTINDYAPNGLQVEGKVEVQKIITGVTASMDKANSQSVTRNVIVVVKNSTEQSISWRSTQETAKRTMSRSPVRRVIKSPVRVLE